MKSQDPVDLEAPHRHIPCSSTWKAYLQRQHFSVNRKKGRHGFGPGAKTGHIPTYTFSSFDVIVCHFKVRTQKFYHFFIDCVFWELLWEKGIKLSQIVMKSYFFMLTMLMDSEMKE